MEMRRIAQQLHSGRIALCRSNVSGTAGQQQTF